MASQAPLPPPADYLGTTFGVSKDQLATVVRNNNIAKIVETCCPTRYLTWNNNGGLQLQGNGSNNKDEHVARSIVVAAYGEALAVKCDEKSGVFAQPPEVRYTPVSKSAWQRRNQFVREVNQHFTLLGVDERADAPAAMVGRRGAKRQQQQPIEQPLTTPRQYFRPLQQAFPGGPLLDCNPQSLQWGRNTYVQTEMRGLLANENLQGNDLHRAVRALHVRLREQYGQTQRAASARPPRLRQAPVASATQTQGGYGSQQQAQDGSIEESDHDDGVDLGGDDIWSASEAAPQFSHPIGSRAPSRSQATTTRRPQHPSPARVQGKHSSRPDSGRSTPYPLERDEQFDQRIKTEERQASESSYGSTVIASSVMRSQTPVTAQLGPSQLSARGGSQLKTPENAERCRQLRSKNK
ncbi:MAG: hypothetical protein GOMPHAMPRED_001891 [Gomphillus americanus]|uniref:Uncharacterized protein n=1 Tax=Gomphillus americanus TaxID=1940652 RepID=A0A8H3F800_9LECA|nr:MAG: hypothetical protein GOMPHAMPRED_001891 [Gomphillus americanus]